MFKIGHFEDKVKAQTCLDYINRQLVIPEPGTLVEEGGEFKLCFDGLTPYPTTRDSSCETQTKEEVNQRERYAHYQAD